MLKKLKYMFFNSGFLKHYYNKYNYQKIINAGNDNILYSFYREKINVDKIDYSKYIHKKIVQLSTYNIICGVATYAKALSNGLNALNIKNDVIPFDCEYSVNTSIDNYKKYFEELVLKLEPYDSIIIQHQVSFFCNVNVSEREAHQYFINFIRQIKQTYPQKNILIYLHTLKTYWDGLDIFTNGIKELNIPIITNSLSIYHILQKYNIETYIGIDPVKKSLLMSDNDGLYRKVKKCLSIKNDDVILLGLGMINHYKRYDELVKILSQLPSKYKLLIMGGTISEYFRPEYEKLINTIKKYKLEKRVYITGLYDEQDLGKILELTNICLATYSLEFTDASGAITNLLLANKPVVCYPINHFNLLNNQLENVKPIFMVTYNNKNKMAKMIQKIWNNKEIYNDLVNQVQLYTNTFNEEYLARLTIKALYQEK